MSTKLNFSNGKTCWVFIIAGMALMTVMALWMSLSYAQPARDLTVSIVPAKKPVAEPVVWVEPVTSTVVVSDTFTIEVMKNTTQTLSAFEFYLVFDSSRVEFINAQAGENVSGEFTHTLRAPGTLQVVGFNVPPAVAVPAGEQAMAEIQFRATDVGTSTLDVIDAAEAPGDPEWTAVYLADINMNPLPDPEVTDGSVLGVEMIWPYKIFLPFVARNL